MAANPRARVFVVFLDTNFVTIAGGHDIAEPLIALMERALGPDDLVGIMTPDMSVTQLVFARKTEVVQEGLRKIADDFASPNHLGPHSVADFEELDDPEERARVQRDAFERFDYLLRLLGVR